LEFQQVDVAFEILRQCGATLHPVAAVQILETLNRPNFRSVNVTANNPFDPGLSGHTHHGFFILGDVSNSSLGLKLQVGGDGPVPEAQPSTESVQMQVEFQNPVIKPGTHTLEQSIEKNQSVQLVPVQYQIASPVDTLVDGSFHEAHSTQIQTQELLHELVMIAEYIGDPGLFPVHPQDFLDHRVGFTAPKPSPSQFPSVDDVPDKVQVPTLMVV
jgi:hypothetical protein